jgi:lysyl-tRNA synthetase class 2
VSEGDLFALEHGLRPAGGFGVGVDRVAMSLGSAASARECSLSPHRRPEFV